MGIFRSEIMIHKKISIPMESKLETMNELGKIDDGIEFVDINTNILENCKSFTPMIKSCEEMEKIILKFERICEQFDIKFYEYNSYDKFLQHIEFNKMNKLQKNRDINYLDIIRDELKEDDKELDSILHNEEEILNSLEKLKEEQAILSKANLMIIGKVPLSKESLEKGYSTNFVHISGVINADDAIRMGRTIFRVSRGRAMPSFFDFKGMEVGRNIIQKKIFTITFFNDSGDSILFNKLYKVCDLFNATRYTIPNTNQIPIKLEKIENEIRLYEDKILRNIRQNLKKFISYRAGDENAEALYSLYKLYIKKEKKIYSCLNKCKVKGSFLIGNVWIPKDKYSQIEKAMQSVVIGHEYKLLANLIDESPSSQPPTYFVLNDLTSPFQQIVNTYGIPRYREANPAIFAIVTFPFLFGVMFGDIGHGLLLLLFGLYLVLYNESLQNSALKPVSKARYLLLLMGFFAFFSGWMYNDFLSIPINLFGSCYDNINTTTEPIGIKRKDCVYPFGIDPKWYIASNELAFFNSLKMKLAVILGVIQMTVGIVIRGLNNIFYGNLVDLLFEFLPMLIFMTSLFGYMIVLIFIKWNTDWSNDPSKAPSIITQLMNIVLKGGSVDGKPMWGSIEAQELTHLILLIIALICIPLLLIPKPIIEYKKKQNNFDNYNIIHDNDDEEENHNNQDSHDEGFGNLFIHQSIETIEFTLGCVSNTASYLRLWALSLAHAQLAKVFFEKSLLGFIQGGNLLLVILGFFIFANITFAVLMCMDLMECFLHTLRLHWVEFQNKFYKADGREFKPFSFKYIIDN